MGKIHPRIDSPLHLTTPKNEEGKWLTQSLKLNKNQLEDLNDFSTVLGALFPNENWLTWLDLSSNNLEKFPEELLKLTELKMLYLHGNKIKTTRDLQKAKKLTKVTKLTLHGNPVELEPGYFITMLTILPQLVKLDFTAVSHNERVAARLIANKEKHARARKD
ncbi:Leucine-rich repeat-containing protein 51 [Sparganum proliferum]